MSMSSNQKPKTKTQTTRKPLTPRGIQYVGWIDEAGKTHHRFKVHVRSKKLAQPVCGYFDTLKEAEDFLASVKHPNFAAEQTQKIKDEMHLVFAPDVEAVLTRYLDKFAKSKKDFLGEKNRIEQTILKVQINAENAKVKSWSNWENEGKDGLISFGSVKIDQVNEHTIYEYVSKRKDQGVKPRTIEREISIINSAFRKAHRAFESAPSSTLSTPDFKAALIAAGNTAFSNIIEGWTNPIPNIDRDVLADHSPHVNRRVSDVELKVILDFFRKSNNTAMLATITLAAESGMRRGEILSLTVGQVDIEKKTIQLTETKTGKPRVVGLTETALQHLKPFLDKKEPTDKVFSYTVHGFNTNWQRTKRATGVSFRFHDLRHEWISKRVEAGNHNAFQLMSMGGFSDAGYFMKSKIDPIKNENAAKKIAAGESVSIEETQLVAGHAGLQQTRDYSESITVPQTVQQTDEKSEKTRIIHGLIKQNEALIKLLLESENQKSE